MSKKYKTQTYKIGEKMYLYKRSDSKYFYCYLYINQKSYRKSLMSTDYDESERLCYEYKNKLLSDSNSEASKENMSFSYFSKKLIEKEKTYQKQQSGLYLYSLTENILNRKKGLISYFGSTDVRSIKSSDFDEFIQQMTLNKKVLSKPTVRQHQNVFRKVLQMNDIRFHFNRLSQNLKKKQRRSYFNFDEYRTIRDKSLELIDYEFRDIDNKYTKYKITEDLHDFIVFMINSSLRPTQNEIYSLKHRDIKIKQTKKKTRYLEFVLNRKNKKMTCQTHTNCVYVYEKLLKRKKKDTDFSMNDYVFYNEYQNRRYCMLRLRVLFNELLRLTDMKTDKEDTNRTLYSLRHSSIIFNCNQKNVNLLDLSRRCDTSLKMIDEFYYSESQQDKQLQSFLELR